MLKEFWKKDPEKSVFTGIVLVTNLSHPVNPQVTVKVCSSIWEKFKGLMFVREIPPDQGALLAESSDSRLNTSIHMFFMNFNILAVWIDHSLKVVDIQIAQKWHPFYISQFPAMYVLETHPSNIKFFHIGDQLSIENV